jgi:hypothetical protein
MTGSGGTRLCHLASVCLPGKRGRVVAVVETEVDLQTAVDQVLTQQ